MCMTTIRDQMMRLNIMDHSLDGLDLSALDEHLRSKGVARSGTLHAAKVVGGHSNLTFVVHDDVSRWVLRRPPLYGVTPSAHDMGREYRVMAALAGTAVPVPAATMHCDDKHVLGAAFTLTEYVSGRVIRTAEELSGIGGAEVIDSCVEALVGVLAELHSIDPQEVGLDDFGQPDGYLLRQVLRWSAQWQHVRLSDDPREDDVRRLTSRLEASVPAGNATSIVHGDFRIDNTIIDAEDASVVRAVVDWEMSTLGDPLSDAALMCVYRDPLREKIGGGGAAWTSPLIPGVDELAQRYALRSGNHLAHWSFYLSLAYFKLAVIAAGVAHRRRHSAALPAGPNSDLDELAAQFISAGLNTSRHSD